jgi:4-hydroxymandelate oxidase
VHLDELESAAAEVLPPHTFALLADAAGEGLSARWNEEAFRSWRLAPRVLRDVSAVDTTLELFGDPVSCPVGIAPLPRMAAVHPDGELGLARAAADRGVVFCAATNSTVALEDLVIDRAPAWFQLYPHRDVGITDDLVSRAVTAGYRAIVITLDRPVPGGKASEARKSTDPADHPNLARYGGAEVVTDRYDPTFTWDRLARLRADCPVPVVVKGVLDPDDARLAIEHGCDGVWVSNHGGRQLDQAVPSLEVLEQVVEAVGGGGEVLLDGGVRRGVDVVIALALGARAVLVGRPLAYALATGGRAGVDEALARFQDRLAHTMALVGAASLRDIHRRQVRRPPGAAAASAARP